MASIDISCVHKLYDKTPAVRGVDLEVEDGEFVVILGPSGCGKSTLLRMIAGLEDISAGQIAIRGQVVNDIEPAQRGCAMVFQNYALYPHMTVAQNIGYALKVSGVSRKERDERVRKIAATLGLEDFLDRKPVPPGCPAIWCPGRISSSTCHAIRASILRFVPLQRG